MRTTTVTATAPRPATATATAQRPQTATATATAQRPQTTTATTTAPRLDLAHLPAEPPQHRRPPQHHTADRHSTAPQTATAPHRRPPQHRTSVLPDLGGGSRHHPPPPPPSEARSDEPSSPALCAGCWRAIRSRSVVGASRRLLARDTLPLAVLRLPRGDAGSSPATADSGTRTGRDLLATGTESCPSKARTDSQFGRQQSGRRGEYCDHRVPDRQTTGRVTTHAT
jgi:hypothetical protein